MGTAAPLVGRSTVSGFAERTRRNLAYIEQAHAQSEGERVHLVTQIVNSLLGLVVFPYGYFLGNQAWRLAATNQVLDELDWPRWKETEGQDLKKAKNLFDLIKYLRHGISHQHITFSGTDGLLSSDDPCPENVVIKITSHEPKSQSKNWEGTMRASDVREFCERFGAWLKATTE